VRACPPRHSRTAIVVANPVTLVQHLHRLASGSQIAASDGQLLEQFVRRRDGAAFATLVARHGPLVLRVCRRLLADHHAADDAFQATFLVLARRAAAIRHPQRLAGWLHGVAYRVALKARTAETLRLGREAPAADLAPRDPHPDPLAQLTARELLALVDEEVQHLPEVYRLPVLLCCLEGHTLEEAARMLCWRPGSVRGRLDRGRARLRERLARRGLTLPAALAAAAIGQETASAGLPMMRADATVRAAMAFVVLDGTGAGTIPSRVMLLAEEGLKGMALSKVKLAAGLVLLSAVLVGGTSLIAYHARMAVAASEEPAAPDAERQELKPSRSDLHGDALPEGAVARLGTVRFRHGNGTAQAFTPDGKTLLSCGGDRTLRFWDAATGRLLGEQ
jgi:RNA polymerase sigma factor (sigma-70 family)